MIAFYCPSCWKDVSKNAKTCPFCGTDIEELLASRNYIEKLIAALNHPEPSTPVRAAMILGKLKANVAVPALINLLRGAGDSYIKAAAAIALGEIGGLVARDALAEAEKSGNVIVRRAALKSLSNALPTSGGELCKNLTTGRGPNGSPST